MDVVNSFEMRFAQTEAGWEVDHPFLLKKQEQCELECVGCSCYVQAVLCVGDEPADVAEIVHAGGRAVKSGPRKAPARTAGQCRTQLHRVVGFAARTTLHPPFHHLHVGIKYVCHRCCHPLRCVQTRLCSQSRTLWAGTVRARSCRISTWRYTDRCVCPSLAQGHTGLHPACIHICLDVRCSHTPAPA